MSIGEAEDYRFYWDERWAPDGDPSDDAPRWVGPTNEAWEGNFKVRYWDQAWQRLILGGPDQPGYLDRVLDAGFDGVYLDIIDGYEFFGPDGDEPERDDAAALMAAFVESIAAHAREQRGVPGFLVFPQNGAGILDQLSATERDRYLAAIDGIGAEDSFYFGDEDEDNALDVQHETLAALRQYEADGLLVLAVDYLTDATKAADFCARARAEGFVPSPGMRDLDALSPQRCLP
jgi:cysteinyl-tRNA synthetase